ncbi:MAG: 2-dehydro-3-deoxygalactonokinase [Paracoccaceae bacterium]|nr:MAG: 2-dehydro-3-deoxygalactonokinase [Paracoccaceae bacterium]
MTGQAGTGPEWLAVDWGTSHLRVWAMQGSTVLDEAASADGMGGLAPDGFEPALLRLVAPWLGDGPVDVRLCGMAGSRQGWHEAPYRAVPCAPLDPDALVAVPVRDARLRVTLVPGLMQAAPPDVMRGEETQIAGALSLLPGFDGVFCLPGTHNKWAHVSAAEVVSFQTVMTGELFALLSGQSVLRHSLGGAGDATADQTDAAFDAALADAMAHPGRVTARLFGLRAEALLSGLDPAVARARLSGLLIGLDLAASRPWWLGQPVVILGDDRLAALYARALAAQGNAPRRLPVRQATLAGLAAARTPARTWP